MTTKATLTPANAASTLEKDLVFEFFRFFSRFECALKEVFGSLVSQNLEHALLTVKVKDRSPVDLETKSHVAPTARRLGRVAPPEARKLVLLSAKLHGMEDLPYGEINFKVRLGKGGKWNVVNVAVTNSVQIPEEEEE